MIEKHDSVIVQHVARLLIPLIQLFAVYVLFHGHDSPGGGFQAGTLVAASMILKLLVGTKKERQLFSIRREFLLASAGVGIFLLIGGASILNHAELLDYSALEWLGKDSAMRRHLGILIAEVGVLLVVSMTFVVIFHEIAILPDSESKKT